MFGPEASFQSSLSSATSGIGPPVLPHHPIACFGEALGFGDDGSLWCPHVKVSPEDPRTRAVLIHSVACLLIEEAAKL